MEDVRFKELLEAGYELLESENGDYFAVFLKYPDVFLIGNNIPCLDEDARQEFARQKVEFFVTTQNGAQKAQKFMMCPILRRVIMEDMTKCNNLYSRETLDVFYGQSMDEVLYAEVYYYNNSHSDYHSNRKD